MGSNLRRQLREALPPSIKGLQRAVALEIADDARYDDSWNYSPEKGRRSKARLADIVRWTAAKDELSVREMLRRLSLAGWEFRLPIGKDKNGNLMYAVPGKAMTFRVPDFEGPTTVGPYVETETEGPTTVGPRTNQGWAMAQPPLGVGPTTVGPGPTTVGPPAPVSSFSTKESPSSSPVAQVSEEGDRNSDPVTEGGGGGGESFSSEDQQQDKPTPDAAAVFVRSLDYRGKPPGGKRIRTLNARVRAALKLGWTEVGLRRYLDISDDPGVRNPAAVYAHRLAEDELPEVEAAAGHLPPACQSCLSTAPESAHNVLLRRNYLDPIGGGPCPRCHPDSVVHNDTKLPPACDSCLDFNRGSVTNVRMRTDHLSFHGGPCPRCHPSQVPGDWHWPGMDAADGGMWERAAARAAQRNGGTGARADSHPAEAYTASSVDDLFASRSNVLPGDRNALGWFQLGQQLGDGPKPMVARPRQPFSNPEDQSVYDAPLSGAEYVVDQSVYDEDF